MKREFSFGSLFSGIGGFDLAFETVGMTCKWQVEIEKNCLKLLEDKFPHARRYTDIRECRGLEPVDLICGGFPCQDLSIAGKRKGLAGERSGLWFEFHRVLEQLRPQWVVIENVPGLLSSNKGRDFAVILSGLAELDYCIAARVLDAQYFGLAQRRKRVFIVASLGNGRCAEVLFESESGAWDPPPRRGERAGVAAAVTSRIGKGGFTDTVNDNVIPFAMTCFENNGHDSRVTEHGDLAPTLQKQMGTGGNNVPLIGVRRLTPLECERLQGFPDNYTAGFADSTRYRMLGNAVAVPCAEWIGSRTATTQGLNL